MRQATNQHHDYPNSSRLYPVRFPAKLQETSNDFPPPPSISIKQGIVEVIDFYEAGIVEVLFIITITRYVFIRSSIAYCFLQLIDISYAHVLVRNVECIDLLH